MNGYLIDSGVLIGLSRHPQIGLREDLEQMKNNGIRLISIQEVLNECRTVPVAVVQELGIQIERTERPIGSPQQMQALDAFQSGVDLSRADRTVIAHAIARQLDVLTTDSSMRNRSYREFLKRLDRMPDRNLPAWHLPEIHVVRAYPHS